MGLFMVVWGASYYFFLAGYKLFSPSLSHHVQSSLSYKLSLLLGLFVMINITLMILDNWTQWIAFLLILAFIILQILITNAPNRYSN